eukprot:8922411-Pyramimonas_sp.AAC.1
MSRLCAHSSPFSEWLTISLREHSSPRASVLVFPPRCAARQSRTQFGHESALSYPSSLSLV